MTIDALYEAALKLSPQVGDSFTETESADVVQEIHDANCCRKVSPAWGAAE